MLAFVRRLVHALAAGPSPAPALVLAHVNHARVASGAFPLSALPGGQAGAPAACPLSRALGGFVGVDGICFDEARLAHAVAHVWGTDVRAAQAGWVVGLPDVLVRFVRAFDRGGYRG